MATTIPSNIGTPRRDDHANMHLAERVTVRTMATMLGMFFLALSAGGLVNPGYMGMHLNLTHTMIHIVSGAVSMYIGLAGTAHAASVFCLAFGAFYSVLALFGFTFGGAAEHTVAGVFHDNVDTHLIRIVPGLLELGVRDHMLHAAIGVLYLATGMFGWLGGTDE